MTIRERTHGAFDEDFRQFCMKQTVRDVAAVLAQTQTQREIVYDILKMAFAAGASAGMAATMAELNIVITEFKEKGRATSSSVD